MLLSTAVALLLGTSQTRIRNLRRANRNGVVGGTGVLSICPCITTYTLILVSSLVRMAAELSVLLVFHQRRKPLLAMIPTRSRPVGIGSAFNQLPASICYAPLFTASMPEERGSEKGRGKEKRKKRKLPFFSQERLLYTLWGEVDQ